MPRNHRATLALICISVLVFLLMRFLDHAPGALGQKFIVRPLLISEFETALPEIRNGQWWRIITPVFLHLNLFHLVFNMLWTWEFGRRIEAGHGALMLLALTALTGIGSNLWQYHATGPWFGGMSGVVYGYFGYLWMQGLFNPAFGMRLIPQIVWVLMVWFAVCWSGVFGWFGLQVANYAHSGGLLGGVVLGLLVAGVARLKRNRRRV